MINEFSLAITNGLGISAIGKTIHTYPTQAEVIKRLETPIIGHALRLL